VGLRISYLDNRGVLREIVNRATQSGFAVSDLTTVRAASGDTDAELDRDDRRGRDLPDAAHPTAVEVTMVLTGHGDVNRLVAELSELDGVLGVRTGGAATEE